MATLMKVELAKEVAKKANVSQEVAKTVIDATIESIKEHIAADDKITLKEFGRFEKRHRAEKSITNILDGGKQTLPAYDVLGFKSVVRF